MPATIKPYRKVAVVFSVSPAAIRETQRMFSSGRR